MITTAQLSRLISSLQSQKLSDEVRLILDEVKSADPVKNKEYNAALEKLLEDTKSEDEAIKTLKKADASMDEKTKAYKTLKDGFERVYASVKDPRLRNLVVHLLLLDSEGFIRAKQGDSDIDAARHELNKLDEDAHAGKINEAAYLTGLDKVKGMIDTLYIPRNVLATMGRDALPVGVNSLVTHQGRMYFVTGISRDKKCPEYGAKINLYDPLLGTRKHVPHSYNRQHVSRARVFFDADGDVACEATGNVVGSYTWETGCEALGFSDRSECEEAVSKYGHPKGKPKIALCRALLDQGLVLTRF